MAKVRNVDAVIRSNLIVNLLFAEKMIYHIQKAHVKNVMI